MTYVTINRMESEMIRNGRKKEAFESMLSRFNRQVQVSGIFKELKEHESYEKPGEKKRRKHREAVQRKRRKEQKDALHHTDTKGFNRQTDKRPSGPTAKR